MSCEVHVRFYDGVGVRFPRATRLVITGNTKELLEDEVKPLTAEFLNSRGLKLSKNKTRITHIEEGFDFLGKHFQKHGGKLLIKPSQWNVQTFLAEIKTTFKENLHAPVDRLLMHLNPKIKGWAMFHRTTTSKKAFSYVDHRIFCELERWMQRRHPDKNLRWCYQMPAMRTEDHSRNRLALASPCLGGERR